MNHQLSSFTDSVWTVDHPLRVAGMQMGTRATIVGLSSGRLAIISPVDFDDETAEAIEELGDVDTIIAPNLNHHFFFNDACRRWPDARALVVPGLDEKVDLVDRATPLGDRGSIEETVYWHTVEAIPYLDEKAFVVPESGVLILTDLAFHYRDHPQWWLRTVMRINGVYGRFGPSRLIRFLVRDGDRLGESLVDILDYSWDSIVVAHGQPVEEDGRRIFIEAFQRYLPETSNRITG